MSTPKAYTASDWLIVIMHVLAAESQSSHFAAVIRSMFLPLPKICQDRNLKSTEENWKTLF